jgi:hypothetical protein
MKMARGTACPAALGGEQKEMIMKREFVAIVGLLLAGSACGCAGWKQSIEEKVRTQATFDLDCKKISVQEIDDQAMVMGHSYTYGARGCGKRATYKGVCAAMGGCQVSSDAQAGDT